VWVAMKVNDNDNFRPFAEGIRERDRSVILNVLRTISYTRDNAYVLHRHIWNDVHEDWPFYSEQDRSTLKR
jgi:RNA polymerase II elongation factor ELL